MKSASRMPFRRSLIAFAVVAAFSPGVHAAAYSWTAGSFSASAVPSTLTSGDTLAISSASSKTFDSGLANQGAVSWVGSALNFNDTVLVGNDTGATWTANSDHTFNGVSGVATFNNKGTFRKGGGTGSTTVLDVKFVNDGGVIDAQTGTILFSGGMVEFNAGTQFSGSGVNKVSNNAQFSGGFSSTNLDLTGGTWTGSAAQASGTAKWSGGYFAGAWNNAGTLNTQGAAAKIFAANAIFQNDGTLNWSGASLRFDDSSQVNNAGLFDAKDNQIFNFIGGATRATFTNAATGTFRKSGGTGTSDVFDVRFINNGGVIDAQTGTLQFSGGYAEFNAGTQFTGVGVNKVSNNAQFNGGFSSANLELAAGTWTGSAAQASGTAKWSGGSFAGAWNNAGTLNAQGAATKSFAADAIFQNDGTLNWSGTNLGFGDSTQVNNAGLFDAKDNNIFNFSGTPATRATFTNAATGTFRKSGGTGTSDVFDVKFVNNGGVIDAQTGTLQFSGGYAEFNAGTQFTGVGVNKVSGNAQFSGGFSSANLELAAGTWTGSAAQASGTAKWSGGSFAGTWNNAGTLNAQGPSTKTFAADAIFQNDGTLNWSGASLGFGDSTQVNNAGLFDAKDNQIFNFSGTPATRATFTNTATGIFRKSGGTGTTNFFDVNFVNAGTLDIQTGTILINPLYFTSSPGSTIMGNGTLQIATLNNAGTLSPGASIGTLTITGDLVMAPGAVLDIEVGNLASFDKLLVNGTASLNGTLALSCFGACSYGVGDEIVILDSTGDLTGQFSGVTLSGFATGAFNVVYDTAADRVLLHVTQDVTPVPEPQTWAMLLAGLGLVGFAARRRLAIPIS